MDNKKVTDISYLFLSSNTSSIFRGRDLPIGLSQQKIRRQRENFSEWLAYLLGVQLGY